MKIYWLSLGAGLLVTLFLMGYVVPRFSSIYEELGSDLPFASRLLMQWGQLLEAHSLEVIVGGAALLAAAGYGLSRRAVRAVVGVLSGASTAENLRREPHTHILPSVANLPELLASKF